MDEQNQPQFSAERTPLAGGAPPPPTAPVTLGRLLLLGGILSIGLLGILGYSFWLGFRSFNAINDQALKTQQEAVALFERRAQEKSQSNIPSEWKTYRNEEYGFEMSFTEDWRGYKVISSGKQKGTYFFCLPTVNKDYPDSHCGGDLHSGYASLFYITIFSHQEWTEEQKKVVGRAIFVAENQDYVVGYGKAQDSPRDLLDQYAKIDQILSTFRFTNKEHQINSYQSCIAAGYAMMKSKPPKCQSGEGLVFVEYESCIQVIAQAKNPQTGEMRDFPTPCDIPEGWQKI